MNIRSTTLDGVFERDWSAPLHEAPSDGDDGVPYTVLDNQLVKLKGGDLIYSHLAVTWNDNVRPHPGWWYTFEGWPCKGSPLPGARAIVYLWRSADAGKSWTRLPDIDAAKLEVPNPFPIPGSRTGFLGYPRHKTEDGKQSSGAGGWDGHHLYADPYSGNLFLTTQAKYGVGAAYKENELSLVLISRNRGNSWQVCYRKDGIAFFRSPVSSLPNGTVAFLYNDGNAVKMGMMRPPYKYGVVEVRHVMTVPGGTTPADAEFNHKNTNQWQFWGTNQIARDLTGAKGFLVSRHIWIPSAAQKNTLVHRLLKVDLPKDLPVRRVGQPIVAERAKGDTIQGTLVEGLPSESLSMLYWIDRDGRSDLDKHKVKFQMYDGSSQMFPKPGVLSMGNGKEYTWQFGSTIPGGSLFVADYMGGASYRKFPDTGERFFVAAWTEPGGELRCNTVTLKKGSAGKSKYPFYTPSIRKVQRIPSQILVGGASGEDGG